MKLRSLLIVCLVLLSAVSMVAQSGGAAGDPISGTWTGHMGPGAIPSVCHHDATGVRRQSHRFRHARGLPSPGEIKSGTFDPKTGALTLQAAPQGDSVARLVSKVHSSWARPPVA